MPQRKLSLNGLVVPPDFPAIPFEKIYKRLVNRFEPNHAVYCEYSAAWNAIPYRFLAATNYSDDFTDSIRKFGSAVNSNERYRQERSIFGFFTNGLSTMEATFYGLYAIGALLNPTFIPMTTAKDLKAISPERTKEVYGKTFPTEHIHTILKETLDDPAYIQLKKVRNILAHRTAPGRTIFVSLDDSEPLPAEWKLMGLSLDDGLTETRRLDLARLLSNVLLATQAFVETKFC